MSCWQYGSAAVDASRTAHLPSSSDHIARSFLCDAFDASGAELFTEQNLKDTFAVTAERAQTSAGWWEERSVHRRWQQGRLLCFESKKVDGLNQHWSFSQRLKPSSSQLWLGRGVNKNESKLGSLCNMRDLLSRVHATICIHCRWRVALSREGQVQA